jgi:predicted nucleotidyltransferase
MKNPIINDSTATQDTMLNILKRDIHALLPAGTSVLLFGSRARGSHRLDSDWDVLVLLNRNGRSNWQDYDTIGYPLNMIFWKHNQDVNTIIQTREEWNQKYFTPFYKNVMEDAIVLI